MKAPKIKVVSLKIPPIKIKKIKLTPIKKIKLTPIKKEKIKKVMQEFKHGALKSGSEKGPRVKKRRQALAIALNYGRKKKRR